ncbi:hypothetical protein AA313_de0201861 [Arthrobotrys entomopaga]|nr:hypothetical protein AA313_de0201861 [Arthrobotrys entomopaga]
MLRTQSCIYILQIKSEAGFRDKSLSFAVNLVGVLKTNEAGGERFVHTTVNPWFGEQIAVLDVKGQLTLWQFNLKNTHRRAYAPLTPKRIFADQIHSGDVKSGVHWANVTWGSTQHDLIIAKRRQLFILNTETGVSTDIWGNIFQDSIRDLELISLTRHPNEPGCLVLLTNYTLHLIEMNPKIKSTLIWKHCRHPEDRSLSCSIWNLDNDPCALLFSRYNPHITVLWRMQTHQLLDLSMLVSRGLDSPLMGLVLLGGLVEDLTNRDRKPRAEIFSLLMIGSKYDIWGQEYTINPNIDDAIFRQTRKPKRAPLSSRMISLSDEGSDTDDSIAGTEDIDLDSSFKRLSLGARKREVSKAFYLDLKEIYDDAFDDESSVYKSGGQTNMQSFMNKYLSTLKLTLLNGDANRSNELLTLLRLKTELQGLFDDVGELTAEIRNICSAEGSKFIILDLESTLITNFMSAMILVSPKESQEANFGQQIMIAKNLYDTLIEIWLESLPTGSPAKLRLRRERIARMVSGEMALSSMGFYRNGGNNTQWRTISFLQRDMEMVANLSQGDYIMETESMEASDMKGGHLANSHVNDEASCMLIERFSPLTHGLVGAYDVEDILGDWDIGKTPDEYQWSEISTIRRHVATSTGRSQSESRKSGRRCRTASKTKGGRILNSASLHEPSMTQPTTRSEISAHIHLASSQASGPKFPSSQTNRGKHGDSRRAKKRRVEGF